MAADLAQPLCAKCLKQRGCRPTALAEAVLGNQMAAAYAREQGGSVWAAQPDGWCLISCLERATTLHRTLLLQRALQTIRDGEVKGSGLAVRAEAGTMLELTTQPSKRQLDRQMATLWDSVVWDWIPLALSKVANRPLHVLSGDVRSGQVSLTVVDEGGAEEPIRLLRSGHEYGVPHYDLVESLSA